MVTFTSFSWLLSAPLPPEARIGVPRIPPGALLCALRPTVFDSHSWRRPLTRQSLPGSIYDSERVPAVTAGRTQRQRASGSRPAYTAASCPHRGTVRLPELRLPVTVQHRRHLLAGSAGCGPRTAIHLLPCCVSQPALARGQQRIDALPVPVDMRLLAKPSD